MSSICCLSATTVRRARYTSAMAAAMPVTTTPANVAASSAAGSRARKVHTARAEAARAGREEKKRVHVGGFTRRTHGVNNDAGEAEKAKYVAQHHHRRRHAAKGRARMPSTPDTMAEPSRIMPMRPARSLSRLSRKPRRDGGGRLSAQSANRRAEQARLRQVALRFRSRARSRRGPPTGSAGVDGGSFGRRRKRPSASTAVVRAAERRAGRSRCWRR